MVITARTITAAFSVTILVISGYGWRTYHDVQSQVTHVDAIAPTKAASGTSAPRIDVGAQNILLIGDDHRPANATAAELAQLSTTEDGGSVATDTMIVMHIPDGGGKATLISLPRDSWVSIPGFGMNKLNAAFAFGSANGGGDAGGARLLINVIQTMTGLHIDHFVRVSLLGFYQIAQILGPIKVCLNEAAQDSYSGTNLPAGVSYLNAQQALSFVRQRHGLPRGDLDREVRQQYFLSAALSKITSAGTLLNLGKVQQLLSAVSSDLETDSSLNLFTLAQQLSDLSTGNVTYATLPTTGTPTITVDGQAVSIVAVDTPALPAFITGIVGEPADYTKATAASPSTVTVQVVNDTGTAGLGTTNTARLAALGFATLAPSDGDVTTVTAIEYPAGQQAQAKAVAAHVPGVIAVVSTTVTVVTLVLGTDGRQVPAPAPTASVSPSGSATAGPSPTASPSATASPDTHAYNPNECIN